MNPFRKKPPVESSPGTPAYVGQAGIVRVFVDTDKHEVLVIDAGDRRAMMVWLTPNDARTLAHYLSIASYKAEP